MTGTENKIETVEALRKAVKIPVAMEILDCSRNKIYTLIYSGELITVKIGGGTYITKESLLNIQKAK